MYDGNEEDIFSSLAVLYAFDTATPYKIYPGHGDSSTLDEERQSNKYMIYAAKNYSI
jgi:glyoxylase-like metal-dependent hydrolase (beta-lactamase superfamily II)